MQSPISKSYGAAYAEGGVAGGGMIEAAAPPAPKQQAVFAPAAAVVQIPSPTSIVLYFVGKFIYIFFEKKHKTHNQS